MANLYDETACRAILNTFDDFFIKNKLAKSVGTFFVSNQTRSTTTIKDGDDMVNIFVIISENKVLLFMGNVIFSEINVFGQAKNNNIENCSYFIEKIMRELSEKIAEAVPKIKTANHDDFLEKKVFFDKDGDVRFKVLRELNFKKSQPVHLQGTINPDDKIFLVRDREGEFVYLLSDMIREELVCFDI